MYDNLQKELEKIANEVKVLYQDKLEKYASSYKLINSINYKVRFANNNYIVSLELEDYWKNVEYGRKPGTFPNVNSLIQWIKDKPIPIGNDITEKQLAYVIGNKIKRDGIQAKHVLSDTLSVAFENINQRIKDAFIKDIKIILNK